MNKSELRTLIKECITELFDDNDAADELRAQDYTNKIHKSTVYYKDGNTEYEYDYVADVEIHIKSGDIQSVNIEEIKPSDPSTPDIDSLPPIVYDKIKRLIKLDVINNF